MLTFYCFCLENPHKTEIIERHPVTRRNQPKARRKKTSESPFPSQKTIPAPKTENTNRKSAAFKSTKWFFAWKTSATSPIGRKTTRLIQAASFGDTSKRKVMMGIKSIPPPSPIPPITPPAIPASTSHTVLIQDT